MTAVRILVRRWYVVILGLALTTVAANAVMGSIAPTYQTIGSVLIIAPSPLQVVGQQVDALSLNPFTRFSAATTVLATVTVQLMDNIEVRERLAAEGAVPDYTVGIAPDQTPIVYVTVVNENEELAIKANALVLASINKELDHRQAIAGAPAESRVRSLVITEPTRGTELVGGRVRAVLAVAVLGLAASLSTAFVVEGFAQSRSRRRTGVLEAGRGTRGKKDRSSSGRESRRSRKRLRKQAVEPAVELAVPVDAPSVEHAVEPAEGTAVDPAGVPAADAAFELARDDAIEPTDEDEAEPAHEVADEHAIEPAVEGADEHAIEEVDERAHDVVGEQAEAHAIEVAVERPDAHVAEDPVEVAVAPPIDPAAEAASQPDGAAEAPVAPPVEPPAQTRPRGRKKATSVEPAAERPVEPRRRARGRAAASEHQADSAPAPDIEPQRIEPAMIETVVEDAAQPRSQTRKRAKTSEPPAGTRGRSRKRAPLVEPIGDAVGDAVIEGAVGAVVESSDGDSPDERRVDRSRQNRQVTRGYPSPPTNDDADT